MRLSHFYNINNAPYEELKKIPILKRKRGNHGGKKDKYMDAICAFDIETTYLPDIEQSIMYVWQAQINDYTIVGRTWDDFKTFCARICEGLSHRERWVFYVHNLSYEFQFLRGIHNFQEDNVFIINNRKILKCIMDNIEFRCSYLLSNMSLDAFLKYMNVPNKKLKYDYKKMRYPWTGLTKKELAYCINDVKGLVQAINEKLKRDNDTLYTIPLTSTGYVRRIVKKEMRSVNWQKLKDIQPDVEIYQMLREAFRGGNTHGNRYYTGEILENVSSYDIASSYPAQQTYNLYPMGSWVKYEGDISFSLMLEMATKHKKCMLMRVRFYDIKLKNKLWGCPYIPRDKSRNKYKCAYDNGRVLAGKMLEITITEIDLKIILDEYEFSEIEILDCYIARSGFLPRAWIDVNMQLFRDKCELKGKDDYLYMKQKNMLNSIYGMTVQDPGKAEIKFVNGDYELSEMSLDDLLAKNQRTPYKSYAWGVWTTAHARYAFEQGLKAVGVYDFVYGDTDSIKYLGNHDTDFARYNENIIKQAKNENRIINYNNRDYIMGIYENEGTYDKFVHFGAKKYAFEKSGKLGITIAGVGKQKGVKELNKRGGIKALKEGFVFREAGGTQSVYNDYPEIKEYSAEGRTIEITSNVAIKESTYTLGITDEYKRLITEPDLWYDIFILNQDIYFK